MGQGSRVGETDFDGHGTHGAWRLIPDGAIFASIGAAHGCAGGLTPGAMKGSKQVQCQIECPNRVGQGTGGNGIDPGGGDIVDCVQSDATTGFEPKPACIEGNSLSEFGQAHVVEQDEVNALERKKVGELFESSCFQLDAHSRVVFTSTIDRFLKGSQGAIGGEMIVFNHDRVIKTHAVIDSASCFDGLFFQQSPSRGSLAGVPNFDWIGLNGVDVTSRHGGHARESLKEIESRAFCCEKGASATFNFNQRVTGGKCAAIGMICPDAEAWIHFFENGFCDHHAGDDSRFACDDSGFAAGVLADEIDGGDITGANVFCECGADEGECGRVHEESWASIAREVNHASVEVPE